MTYTFAAFAVWQMGVSLAAAILFFTSSIPSPFAEMGGIIAMIAFVMWATLLWYRVSKSDVNDV